MATKTFNARIANKRDTSANWTSNNPVLLNGEVIIVDTEAGQVRYKVGNGTSTYTQLPFTDESLITNINGKLSLSGGTMTGNIDMGGHKLTGLGAPVNPNDAVRQTDLKVVSDEVDGIIAGTTGITLAPATTTKIGGVIVGDGIEVEADGTISTNPVPAGGTNGQILTQSANGPEWQNAPSGLPDGGTEGQMLYKSADGAAWGDRPIEYVTLTSTDGTYTSDKTYSEIMDAINAGVIVIAKESASDTSAYSFYALMGYNDEVIAFGYSTNTEGHQYIIKSDNSVQVVEYSYGLTTHGGTMDEYSEIETVPDDSGNKTTLSFYENRISISTNSGDHAGIDVTGSTFKGENSSFVDVRGKYVRIGGEWWYGDSAHSDAIRIEEVTPGDVDTGQKPVYSTKIHFLVDPTESLDAANKRYVDTQLSAKLTTPTGTKGQLLGFTADNTVGAVDAPESGLTQEQADERYLQLTGGTLTGALTLNGEPTEDLQAVPKQYVDALKPLARTITLTTSGWSSNTQTVTVSGVVASETAQLITPTPAIASQSAYYEAGIMCTGQAANSLRFTCQTVPTSNLTVYVVIQPLG